MELGYNELTEQYGFTVYLLYFYFYFLDSSMRSQKGQLRHNGNLIGAILIGHSVHLKKEYGLKKNSIRFTQI